MRFVSLLALASLLLPVSTALAQNQPIRVRNTAPVSATAIFLATSGTSAWGPNLLGGLFLPPRAFLSVQLGEGGGCRFDIRMVLRDGREVLRRDVDVCAERVVVMALDPAPPPEAPAAATPAPAAPQGRP
jgi:serine protease Do